MIKTNYNPDVLTCLANLSNDEVFTPPHLANQMLDTLPAELWSNPKAKFLDPFCKSGVFLREIAKRLIKGLESFEPDLQKRIDHIMQNQLYGIGITELTALLSRRSLYCTKKANGEYAVATVFDTQDGNIAYERTPHTFRSLRGAETNQCIHCGASREVYDRGDELETHAYQFIHHKNPFENMQFDVIIGNPPYQLSDGGGTGTSAMPLYHRFIQQAKKLGPRYILMIIPARWYSGGKGLNEFRSEMLNDDRIRIIYDFPDATSVFPGVQIKGGVCFFLWDRDNRGLCKVYSNNNKKDTSVMERPLLEKNAETFIRFNEAVGIVHKVQKWEENSIYEQISSRKPFGLDSNFSQFSKKVTLDKNIKLYRFGENGFINIEQVTKNRTLINKTKVIISKAGSGSDSFPHQILNIPILSEPNSVCTETYIILGVFDEEKFAKNLITYVTTRFFRFLVLLNKPTQNASKSVYQFVPLQDFSESWTDEKLYKKYGLTQEEIDFIESMIRPME